MRNRLRQAVVGMSLLSGIPWFPSGCRCQGDGPDSKATSARWSAPEPFKVTDESLADDEYMSIGLAAHGRNWGTEEMKQAADRLEMLTLKHLGQLPRYASPRSGRVFARIVSADNLGAFNDQSLPVAIRLPAAAEYLSALNTVRKLYVAAANQQQMSGNDVVELNGAWLRTTRVVLTLIDEYLLRLSPDDPTTQARRLALDQMRQGLEWTLSEILGSILDPRLYGLPARGRLVVHLSDSLPAITPKLALRSRQALLRQLNDAVANPNLANLQPSLGALRDMLEHPMAEQPMVR